MQERLCILYGLAVIWVRKDNILQNLKAVKSKEEEIHLRWQNRCVLYMVKMIKEHSQEKTEDKTDIIMK